MEEEKKMIKVFISIDVTAAGLVTTHKELIGHATYTYKELNLFSSHFQQHFRPYLTLA